MNDDNMRALGFPFEPIRELRQNLLFLCVTVSCSKVFKFPANVFGIFIFCIVTGLISECIGAQLSHLGTSYQFSYIP